MSTCWKCGEPGHYAYDCPLSLRALTFTDHLDRIAMIVSQWISGAISIEQKRIKISEENTLWHGADVPRHLIYAPRD